MKTIILLSNQQNQTVTFYRPPDRNFYVGYRFLEGRPEISETPHQDYSLQPTFAARDSLHVESKSLQYDDHNIAQKGWLARYDGMVDTLGARMKFNSNQDGSAKLEIKQLNAHLDLEIFFQPDYDGIQTIMKIHTTCEIAGSYPLQQCLRFTGNMNQDWRTKIAHVPYLSEFDMQAMGRPNSTLTFYRQGGVWSQFPVQYTTIQTKIPEYNHKDRMIANHGLVVRESPHRDEAPKWYWERVAPGMEWDQISAGLYWERTLKISNRHPADCIHAWVDIGPLAVGETRIIRGKIYYLEGSKENLLSNWKRDFPAVTAYTT